MAENESTDANASKQDALARHQQALQLELQLSQVSRQLLTPDAKMRLDNVKLVDREKYLSVMKTLVYLHEKGQINGRIDEDQLKRFLMTTQNERKPQMKIIRK